MTLENLSKRSRGGHTDGRSKGIQNSRPISIRLWFASRLETPTSRINTERTRFIFRAHDSNNVDKTSRAFISSRHSSEEFFYVLNRESRSRRRAICAGPMEDGDDRTGRSGSGLRSDKQCGHVYFLCRALFLLGIPGERSTREEGYRQHHPRRRRYREIQFRAIRSDQAQRVVA